MVNIESDSYFEFDLPLPTADEEYKRNAVKAHIKSLPPSLLIENVKWFSQLRWIVIAVLLIFGLIGFSESLMHNYGLRQPGYWPFYFVVLLIAANLFFIKHASGDISSDLVLKNLWTQIVIDMIVLAAAIHYIGSLETFISFVYLFHIVLSCVFLNRKDSLIVTLFACGLFIGCVTLEQTGVIQPTCVFVTSNQTSSNLAAVWGLFSAVGIWLVVWYLASHLSTMVHLREMELLQANEKLALANAERISHMKITTHELKSPFAAISSNANLMLEGYCGEMPPKAVPVLHKILQRCKRLSKGIQDILVLANISSQSNKEVEFEEVDMSQTLGFCFEQVKSIAENRKIHIDLEVQPLKVYGVDDNLKTMLTNLMANAVHYSYDNSNVKVKCFADPQGAAVVTVADEGIGIPAEKLPHIFDEHFRTSEARQHNQISSGLGLAIVKNIALNHKVNINVKSRPLKGAVFTLRFPTK